MVIADYGEIADDDVEAQQEAEIDAIRSFYPSTVAIVPAEGWLDTEGRYYACHDDESHDQLARRICAVRFRRLGNGSDLERRGWLYITASTNRLAEVLVGVFPTQAQQDTLFDLSQCGDYTWRTFMHRVLAALNDEYAEND